MIVARTRAELNAALHNLRAQAKQIGFVPTMGALHDGHLSLVELCKQRSAHVVVSIFVNPTQFGPQEDFLRYPRTPEQDLALLRSSGVDLVWLPSAHEMYGEAETISVDPGPVSLSYEGAIRPGHFRGVLTVVAKFFHQIKPDFAVFGQKDAQQLFLIQKMVEDLQFPLEIVAGETCREANGLARSSRNVYLKKSERAVAPQLYNSLRRGLETLNSGVRDCDRIEEAMRTEIHDEAMSIDYLTVVHQADFLRPDAVTGPALLIGALRVGSVRLIDNLVWNGSTELVDH